MRKSSTRRFRVFVILVSIVALLAVPPGVNATGILFGQVIGLDRNEQPVPLQDAKVTVYTNGTITQSVSLHRFDGSYSMYLPHGVYVVTAECAGFNPQSRVIAISDEHPTRLDFYLQRAPAIKGNTFDFGLSSHGSITVLAGESSWTTIRVTLHSGPPQTVNVSVSGLPYGAYASLSPPIVNPSFPVICTVTTSHATPLGTYNVTVTGVGGGLTHSISFTLIIRSHIILVPHRNA